MKKTNVVLLAIAVTLFNSCTQLTSTSKNNDSSKVTLKDTLIAGDYILNVEEICSFQTNDFYNNCYALEAEDLKNIFGNYFTKTDNVLSLKLANGKTVKYVDVKSEDDSIQIERGVHYEFKYYFEDIEYYLLDVGLWEGGYGLLVNRKNGLSKEITGLPYISKNHKKIICINEDLESGYTTNGIELYTVLNDSLQTEFRKSIEGWGPADISWINENQILLKTERFQNETGERITEFKRVTIEKKTSP